MVCAYFVRLQPEVVAHGARELRKEGESLCARGAVRAALVQALRRTFDNRTYDVRVLVRTQRARLRHGRSVDAVQQHLLAHALCEIGAQAPL